MVTCDIRVQVSIEAPDGRVSRKALSGKKKLKLLDGLIRYIFVNSHGTYSITRKVNRQNK